MYSAIYITYVRFVFCEKLKSNSWFYVKHMSGQPAIGDEENKNDGSLFFDLSTLRTATNNFSDTNKLGQGGFGPVYKVLEYYSMGN